MIEGCYREFLREGHNPELREYPDDADQIREILVHTNYLSMKDIQTCASTDLAPVQDEENAGAMEGLHSFLRAQYAELMEEEYLA